MAHDLVSIGLKLIVPTPSGTALFLGDDAKVFVIYVDAHSGQLLADTLAGQKRERPLTHDLIGHIFTGFGVTVDRMVINHAGEGVFHSRLLLSMKNELGSKYVEIDARPSDALILCLRDKRPVAIIREVFESLEDMSELLKKLREQQKKA